MTRRLRLNVNILNAGVFGGSWRFPGTEPLASFDVEHYTSIALKAERAKLDAVFLADSPVLDPLVRYRPANSLEPTTILARIAAVTNRIGLVGTLSSTYNDPAELARRVGDLDHLSGGRVGWNVVTTAGAAAARNFGHRAEPEHRLRYQRAARFTAEVIASWDARSVLQSPQGRPVVVQAGGSSDGRLFASQFGEVIFSAEQDIERARSFRDEIRSGAQAFGRSADSVVVLPGLSTVIGSTEAEARRRREVLDELLPRQLLRKLGGGGGHRIVVGTPEQIADDVEGWFLAGAADGFNVMPDVLPSGLDDFVEQVVPELQRRNLFRQEYVGSTLRHHLGLAYPRSAAAVSGSRTFHVVSGAGGTAR